METVQGISKFKSTLPTVITIGTFDGVHIGHRKILQRLINNAKQGSYNSVLLTFFPHPRMVLQKENGIKLLNTLEDKVINIRGSIFSKTMVITNDDFFNF